MKRKIRFTVERWGWILGYSFVGGVVGAHGDKLYWRLIDGVSSAGGVISPRWTQVTGYAIAAVLLGALLCFLRPRWSHFRRLLAFPPLLTAVAIGYSVALIASGRVFLDTWAAGAFAWLPVEAFALAILVSWIPWRRRRAVATPTPESVPDTVGGKLEFQRVAEWLRSEAPIASSKDDLIGFDHRADRIARILKEPRESDDDSHRRKTAAIWGPFGIGKTTLAHLVAEKLSREESPAFVVAHASCWGFEDSARAQEQILETCIEALSGRVDCLSIRRMPASYSEAISATEGVVKPLLSVLWGISQPEAELERLIPILDAANLHLVVVVEDIDRTGRDFDTSQIIATLHRLRQIDRVSFIVTCSTGSPVDLLKVVEHVEYLDALNPAVPLLFLDTVRTQLRSQRYFDPEQLRPPDRRNRPENLYVDAVTLAEMEPFVHRQLLNWCRDAASLLGTPRLLKNTLAVLIDTWDRLRGEVDLDELILMLSLKQGAGEAYHFLLSSMSEIRLLKEISGPNQTSAEERKDRDAVKTALEERWRETVRGGSFDAHAAAVALWELFPILGTVLGNRSMMPPRWRVQSIRGEHGSRYLRRIVSGEIESNETRDQVVLQLMEGVSKGDHGAQSLARAILEDKRVAELTMFFEDHLAVVSEKQRLRVVSSLLSVLREREGASASFDAEEISRIADWIPRLGGNLDERKEWYLCELRASLPQHVRLAAGLIQQIVQHPTLRDHAFADVMNEVKARLASADGNEFAAGLDPNVPHTLNRLLCSHGDDEQTVIAGWSWLGGTILRALSVAPDIAALQAAISFKDDSQDPPQFFLPQMLEAFFGTDVRRFCEALVKSGIPSSSEKWVPGFLEKARAAAAAMLAQMAAPSTDARQDSRDASEGDQGGQS